MCEPCGSRFVEGHQAFEGRVTARAARRLVKDARAMTVNAAAERRQVRVCKAVKVVVSDGSKAHKAAPDALGELHNLYLAKDRKGTLEALDRFADTYRTGHIPEFSDSVDTFLAWHNQILDWHHAGRPSNGCIDRIDNLLQVLRRKAHGFTICANFEARGLLLT